MTLLYDAGRLWIDVTTELPVTSYPPGSAPDPGRVAGIDLGVIHPFAAACPTDGTALLVSGRAIRAEHRLHLTDTNTAAAPPPAAPLTKAGAGRDAGARPAAAPASSRPGTAAGSGKPCTKPPRPWSAGPSRNRSAR